jgi:hypothetical protein
MSAFDYQGVYFKADNPKKSSSSIWMKLAEDDIDTVMTILAISFIVVSVIEVIITGKTSAERRHKDAINVGGVLYVPVGSL